MWRVMWCDVVRCSYQSSSDRSEMSIIIQGALCVCVCVYITAKIFRESRRISCPRTTQRTFIFGTCSICRWQHWCLCTFVSYHQLTGWWKSNSVVLLGVCVNIGRLSNGYTVDKPREWVSATVSMIRAHYNVYSARPWMDGWMNGSIDRY